MLNAASILFRNFGIHPCRDKLLRKKMMLFINLFGKLQSQFCQGECAVGIFYKMTGFGQFLDSSAYRGLFYS